MAVKKANKKDEVNVTPEVEVEETAVEATETQSVETEVETPVEDVEETTPEVEVETPVEDTPLEVDTSVADVDTSNQPAEKVKIRMRVDHTCTIAMERYDLKAGKTYVVPKNVKNILNKAGYLAPL